MFDRYATSQLAMRARHRRTYNPAMPGTGKVHGSKGGRYLAAASVALLVLGFVGDISTSHDLVVAITYNIPIALSSLALSRRLTLSLVGLALFADAAAGYVNAIPQGGPDLTSAANRGLAALSYLLVGFLTLMLRNASSRITALQLGEARAKREGDLRRLITELSGPLRPQAFLERACVLLRALLEADAVAICGVAQGRFTGPGACDPPGASMAKEGCVVPWAVASTGQGRPDVVTSHAGGTTYTVGRWPRGPEPDFVVMASRARVAEVSALLSEALTALGPLYARAMLLEDLDSQRTELARRNAVIRDLVYAFSHDLRTPLMANAMNMQLALDGAFGDLGPEFRRTLENGLEANQDLLDLADALLLVARYESGESPGKPEAVNLVTLLRQALARLDPVLQSRGLRVETDAPEVLTVPGRPAELRRAIQNLLDNAAKFSNQGAVIEVRLSCYRGGASLRLLDRGPGVSERQRDRLFQRFSSGRAGGGTGLGLYLANQIVTGHGGNMSYEPREGGGSCFSIWLPTAWKAERS